MGPRVGTPIKKSSGRACSVICLVGAAQKHNHSGLGPGGAAGVAAHSVGDGRVGRYRALLHGRCGGVAYT